jgi:hypothetical protein
MEQAMEQAMTTPRMSREEVIEYARRCLGFTHYLTASGPVPLESFGQGPASKGWRYVIKKDHDGRTIILDSPEKLIDEPFALRAFPLERYPKGNLIVVTCAICQTPFEAHRNCQLVKEGRTYCEAHSVLRGPAWWLIYKKALSPEKAGASNAETWREAEQEYRADQGRR